MTLVPPSLRELQGWIQWAITSPAGPRVALGEATEGPAAAPGQRDWAKVLTPECPNERALRLDVYGDGYLARMTEALAETYETIERILGRAAFNEIVRRYVERHPSEHPNLTELGRHFATFLERDPIATELPVLPDLARLERALIVSYHARAETPLPSSELEGFTPDRFGECRIAFQPHLFALRSRWPVRSLRRDRDDPGVAERARTATSPEAIVGYRDGLDVVLREPPDGELVCLQALLAGASVAEAVECIVDDAGASPPVGEWFGSWMAVGLVTALVE